MRHRTEILFIDPGVDDIATLLAGVRPEVEPIVLAPDRPAASQMAEVLAWRREFIALHVIAHGEPGRVHFAAGDWSAETLEEEAASFSMIGRALREDGAIRLWSCYTGARDEGATFAADLRKATGRGVAAARRLVGAAALGGLWELRTGSNGSVPPLTESGVAAYASILVPFTFRVTPGGVDNWNNATAWGGIVPSQSPAPPVDLTFISDHTSSGNSEVGQNVIYMPPTLLQGTGQAST